MCRNRKSGFRFYDLWQQVLDSPPRAIENFLILITSKAATDANKISKKPPKINKTARIRAKP